MSAGSDNVFARWSRRKRAARYSATAEPEKDQLAADAAAAPAGIGEQLAPAIVEPEAAEPAEPLPRVEDLTAQSDLSAFLHKGVPKMLKRAALRKMWSLDPAIRDHIGPSEYAWDFNRPGSMAGFGPLKASSEAVVDFLSTLSGGNPADPARAAMASEAPEKPPAATAVLADEDASASPDGSQPITPDSSIEPALPQSPSADVAETATGRDEAAGAATSPPSNRQRRHGGAVPR
ncbi:MAG: DUF3306 domain-containing protein [Mesorhizobium sp.]|uniref:DUF3306 domain-containing protein n=1 Tax=unclassified Mesorhizobium TaxID=325217 RepID=UPI000FCC3CFA|nr:MULTISPECIES: DUF3306 domain-containing protein [unclassified Mesorhizobium]RUV72724.1 DUF3306 domain-containing protein [Mesorhizobium sp. M5C.F.Cr.IN.023.01.1.1]RWF90497.1 MAG: DUF3306 domain-containing protein [Mesorhizobium sp.]RWF96805.1 MAG: DUF3306 domain-containing protein [Mesorhizobium sp.]RWI42254.1 MAG: DUF3306 domain-containing protein [Mesorhizobium sp.]RWI61883.1 MAG: DUF3306 domain-containing protein [Mesorhizobium sp.]